MTTTQAPEAAELARKIEDRMAAKGVSRKSIYTKAGMSRDSFERSMVGTRSFTVIEIMNVSAALGVMVRDILPDTFTKPAQHSAVAA